MRAVDLVVVLALLLVAAYKRWLGVAQSSLWLDDAWVALGARDAPLHEFTAFGLTSPGFGLILRPFVTYFSMESTLWAQVVPMASACLAPGLLYLVLVDRRIRRGIALAAGILLAGAPLHAEYSVAVKQYTTEAVLVLGLLWSVWRLLDEGYDRRRWLQLLALTAVSVVVSFQTAIPAAIGVAVVGGSALWAARDRRFVLATGVATAAFVASWWMLVITPKLSPELHHFWRLFYIGVGPGARGTADNITTAWSRLLWGIVRIDATTSRTILLVSAAVVAVRRPRLGIVLVGPLGVVTVLACLKYVPIGARTDIQLFPLILALVALATDQALDRLPTGGRFAAPWRAATVAGQALAVGAACLALVALERPHYPLEDLRPLVAELDSSRMPGDRVLVAPWTQFAFGFYSSSPSRLERDDTWMTGYTVDFDDPGIVVVPDHRDDPAAFGPFVRDAAVGADRIWIIGRTLGEGVTGIDRALEGLGFRLARRVDSPGVALHLWTRRARSG